MGESGPAKFYTPWVPTGIDWQEVLTRAMLQSRAEDDPPRDSAVAQSANETPRSVASLAVRANGHRVSGQCSTQLSPRMMTPGRSASQGQLTGVRPLSGPSPRFAAPCGPSPRLTPMGTGTPGSAGGRATGTPPVPRQLRRREMKDAKKHARGGRGTPRTGAGLVRGLGVLGHCGGSCCVRGTCRCAWAAEARLPARFFGTSVCIFVG